MYQINRNHREIVRNIRIVGRVEKNALIFWCSRLASLRTSNNAL